MFFVVCYSLCVVRCSLFLDSLRVACCLVFGVGCLSLVADDVLFGACSTCFFCLLIVVLWVLVVV